MHDPETRADIAVIGAGAAGLMASIAAARAAPGLRVVALDGARTLGAKILVAGGGRCNVTHHAVDESDFSGSTPPAIRNLLRRFSVDDTIRFFRELGVELKREETGKLFPTTDSARTVLDALLRAARDARVEILHPWRVTAVRAVELGFEINADPHPTLRARRVILATGGLSLPKSGSDGLGHAMSRGLGHSITPRVVPALVPLTLPKEHWLCTLAGIAVPVRLELRNGSGSLLADATGPMLLAHFGISGPAALDISRHVILARLDDPRASLAACFLPESTPELLDRELETRSHSGARESIAGFLSTALPDRLARGLILAAGLDPTLAARALTRDQRRALVATVMRLPLPIVGDRGFSHAEVTAGGVPLRELRLDTLESRIRMGLHICGELCDVDGRIGGFNFQWAWASGHVAGTGAASAITDTPAEDAPAS